MGADSSCVTSGPPQAPDESPVLGSPGKGRFSSEPFLSRFPDLPHVATLEDLFQHTRQIAPDVEFYGNRAYARGEWQPHWNFVSRTTFATRRNAIGSYLVAMGVQDGAHIGIMSQSRLEWVLVQYACYGYGFIPTPVFDTFGWDKVNYIIDFASITVLFIISTKVRDLLERLDEGSCLTDIVVIDQEDAPYDYAGGPATDVRIHRFQDVVSYSDQIFPLKPPRADTPAFLMFTSGTTSQPKGCVITHANLIAAAASVVTYAFRLDNTDSLLSFLPLAHIFEASLHVVGLKVIGRLAFWSGDIRRVAEEMKLFRPTAMTAVSRVYERFKEAIEAAVSQESWVARSVFYAAFHTKKFMTFKLRRTNLPIVDRVFDRVREKFGGRLRVMVSGGSALPADVQDFLRVACHCEFCQGYGLTETTACSCSQIVGDIGHDNVGAPLPCCEAKLKSVENYSVQDNTGELWIRGPSIFPGYYRDDDGTRAVFDDRGFFRTGDVFQLTPTRQLRMVARVKEVVKLAQGEYISLQKLTAIYSTAKYVDQIYIHAGMTSRFLVAIIVIASENAGLTKEQVLAELAKVAKENRLNGFERINDVFLTTEQFTTANGLMTPSMKVSGFAVEKRYKQELERLNQ